MNDHPTIKQIVDSELSELCRITTPIEYASIRRIVKTWSEKLTEPRTEEEALQARARIAMWIISVRGAL